MTGPLRHVGHLARRFATSLSRRPVPVADLEWVAARLTPGEWQLWRAMSASDQRHALEVARRFVARRPAATRPEVAGALLHDVGKVDAALGTWGRALATVVGPRTTRSKAYHDHEATGARWAAAAGSDPVTVALITGQGPAAADLKAADDSI